MTAAREDLRRRLAALSPERRAALRRSLLGEGRPERTWPLSIGQERLWFLQRFDPGDTSYHITWPVRLRGPIDEPALAAAFTTIAARHEVLRTRFVVSGDLPGQAIDPPRPVALDTLAAEPEDGEPGGLSRIDRAIAAYAGRPFDLAAAPAWRAGLLPLGPGEAMLVIVLHHIIADHWSLDVLMRELAECYAARREGREPDLAEPALQYREYAVAERRRADEEGGAHLAYWTERLAGVTPLDLPTDHPRPAHWSGNGARLFVAVPDEDVTRLEQVARARRATLFMALLGAYQITLGAAAGQDDFCVGVPVAGRDRTELAGLIGYFSTTLVARADLSGDPTYSELLRRIRVSTLKNLGHAGTSFERILGALRLPRDLSRPPLCQAMFNLSHNLPKDDLLRTEMADLTLAVHPPPDLHRARVEVSLEVYRGPEGVGGWLEYATDLFTEKTARHLGDAFAQVVKKVAENPDLRLSELCPDGRRGR